MNRSILLVLSLAVAIAIVFPIVSPGCGRADPTGPPELRLGRDECAECKMSIVDQRCAGCILAITPDGILAFVFDDIDCMIKYQKSNPEIQISGRFVQDYREKRWLSAVEASFLKGTTAKTAMGSGIIAFSDKALAKTATTEFGGQVVSWEELIPAESPSIPKGE